MRARTSWNQANGSTTHRLQVAMKVRSTAAVLPPLSLPKNVQFAPTNRNVPIGPFGGAVVDFQLAVFQKTRQRFPLV